MEAWLAGNSIKMEGRPNGGARTVRPPRPREDLPPESNGRAGAISAQTLNRPADPLILACHRDADSETGGRKG